MRRLFMQFLALIFTSLTYGWISNEFLMFPLKDHYQMQTVIQSLTLSIYECSLKCSQDPNPCIGFNYFTMNGVPNDDSKNCQLLKEHGPALTWLNGSRYYQMLSNNCQPKCGKNSNCVVKSNGEPFCRCNTWPKHCGPNCDQTLYKFYEDEALNGHDIEYISNIKLEDAMTMCLIRPNCRSFDYYRSTKMAAIQHVPALPESLMPYNGLTLMEITSCGKEF